jgi:hypothetical protein
MGVLRTVVQEAVLPVFSAREDLSLRHSFSADR